MLGRTAWALTVGALTLSSPAFAALYPQALNISAGPLPDSLQILESQTGIELLYDHTLIIGLQSPPVHGDFTTEAALRQLLADTSLTARRAKSGAWIVERSAAPPLLQQDAVIPEILVVGQRTQNADIRRFENDVQPYTVVTKAELVSADRDNVDQFFTSRITQNTTVVPPSLTQTGSTVSEINLRGLGSDNTLILIDGRRMPGLPDAASGFKQSDLNTIPMHAIKRIEVLTGSAGGIYGLGALGGVVNVVLDRDSQGLDLYVTDGISSRGDSGRHGVELSFGHTSQDAQSDLSLFASYDQSDSPLVGQRSYRVRDLQQIAAQAPGNYLQQQLHGNSVTVDGGGTNLTFKPAYGGAQLPSDHTFLPVGFSGSMSALASALTQHAGTLDSTLADGDANSDLGSNPRSQSLMMNVRHRFGAQLEVYADVLMLESRGRTTSRSADGHAIIEPNSPANPFTSSIVVHFPVPQAEQQMESHDENTRYTAGLLAELPFDWRGTMEASFGSFRYSLQYSMDLFTQNYLFLSGAPSDLQTNPLGDWQAFQTALGSGKGRIWLDLPISSRFRNGSLRLAGPVFKTAEGPATLTLLAERRSDDLPAQTQSVTEQINGTTTSIQGVAPSRSKNTTSLSGEFRARLIGEHAPVALLRDLELQLAIRRDDQKNDFTRNPSLADGERLHPEFVATAYTVGAKITPSPWLTLRSSVATGGQPPTPDALREAGELTTTFISGTDPKRGNSNLGVDGPILWKAGGYAGLKPATANTFFLGSMIMPFGEDGPRFGIDYSRIRLIDLDVGLLPDTVLEHENFWPERVIRAPLTDADRAKGYTAGRILILDTRRTNGAGLDVDTLDTHVQWPLRVTGGRLRLYADATYQMKNLSRSLFEPEVENAGYQDGPLKWRVNGGVMWSTAQVTIGANLQYFDSSVLRPGPPGSSAAIQIEAQGSQRISSQTYLDLHATWRPPLRRDVLTVDFGVVNVLDRAPPRLTGEPGYSRYGDPRQRRFELVLRAHF